VTLTALTLKRSTDEFTRTQTDVKYELIENHDEVMNDPARALGGNRPSLEMICEELGVSSIWPFAQSLRNHVRSYGESYAPNIENFRGVIRALVELVQRGIHHGDLHAGNVVIDSEYRFLTSVSDRTALAIDVATLIGSLLIVNPDAEIENYWEAIESVADHSLVSDVRTATNEYGSENRWLRTIDQRLKRGRDG
jgi:tRNA A-37 threonylcarbamoyl transferase component Bud32